MIAAETGYDASHVVDLPVPARTDEGDPPGSGSPTRTRIDEGTSRGADVVGLEDIHHGQHDAPRRAGDDTHRPRSQVQPLDMQPGGRQVRQLGTVAAQRRSIGGVDIGQPPHARRGEG